MIPQLIQLLRYRFVAYSYAILANPPRTFCFYVACSLADPSPGWFAKITDPMAVFRLFAPFGWFNLSKISSNFGNFDPFRLSDSRSRIFLARFTYSGTRRESVKSAQFTGFDRFDEVSLEGINSSVVVTGSLITAANTSSRFSANGYISGQGVIFGLYLNSTSFCGFLYPQ